LNETVRIKEIMATKNPDEGYCSERPTDYIHCECWWDGDECCACGHPEKLNDKEVELE